jgi:DNA uptake protein ComE-like DNA-binding protein
MDIDDWYVLPGIESVLAERVVHDRQLNGDFASYSDLTGFLVLEK